MSADDVFVCEREGCDAVGQHYFSDGHTIHVSLGIGIVQVGNGHHKTPWGHITLCSEHALEDLGVAFP